MPAQLLITLHEDGKVELGGPLENKDLCYRLLFEALIAIKNFEKKLVIESPTEKLFPFLGKGGKT